MKIIIVSSVYPPEPIVSAQTSALLAEALVELGHQVHVITAFPNRPKGVIYQGYKRKLYQSIHKEKNYKITRCFSFFSKRSTIISRFAENLSFGLLSSLFLFFTDRPAVVYANTWPLFSQGLLSLVCKVKKIPFILSIQDIYPESLVSQERLNTNSIIIRILRYFDKIIAHSTNALILISKGFEEIYLKTRHVPKERIQIIPNFLDDIFKDAKIDSTYREVLDISKGELVFVYGGNISVAAGLKQVIEAFPSHMNSSHFVIAGSGSQLEQCKELSYGKPYIHFISPWPESETQKLLLTGDVALLPTSGEQSLASLPSKLINYLLAGKPVLAIALPESDISKIIRETGCGWVVPPGNKDLLEKFIKKTIETPKDELLKMGQKGRSYALDHFTDEVCLPKIISIIEKIGSEK